MGTAPRLFAARAVQLVGFALIALGTIYWISGAISVQWMADNVPDSQHKEYKHLQIFGFQDQVCDCVNWKREPKHDVSITCSDMITNGRNASSSFWNGTYAYGNGINVASRYALITSALAVLELGLLRSAPAVALPVLQKALWAAQLGAISYTVYLAFTVMHALDMFWRWGCTESPNFVDYGVRPGRHVLPHPRQRVDHVRAIGAGRDDGAVLAAQRRAVVSAGGDVADGYGMLAVRVESLLRARHGSDPRGGGPRGQALRSVASVRLQAASLRGGAAVHQVHGGGHSRFRGALRRVAGADRFRALSQR
jgi:hypothetical protein